MTALLQQLFAASGFMPHGHCYLWRPEIVATHVIADSIIALSYWSIPFSLYYVIRRQRDVPVQWMIGLFAIFIACGVTHLMEVITVWKPLYVTSGLIKAFTAVVSALTAIMLVPLIPRLLSLKSPQELELLNQQLQREIEERRSIERELRASHATLEAVVNASPLSILAIGAKGEVTLWNPAAEALFGFSKSEVLGQQPPHVPEAEREAYDHFVAQEFAGASFREIECKRQTKDGRMVDVAAWTAPLVVDGQVVGAMHVLSDITERKALERERAAFAQLLEQRVAERTAELEETNRALTLRNEENETFVYSVSHDLRSPLVNLQGFSQELVAASSQLRELFEHPQIPKPLAEQGLAIIDGDVKEAVHYIQTAVIHQSEILASLLRLSRAGRVTLKPQQLDMQTIVEQVVSDKTVARSEGIQVEIKDLPSAWADRDAIEQVFMHLVDNAVRYRRQDPTASVEIGALPHGEEEQRTGAEARYSTYYVRDTGLGIAKELQRKAFQPFQRLHPQIPGGEGMGLALSRRIVERHGGRIWFESEAGVGSTFFLTLPRNSPSTSRDPRSIHESPTRADSAG